MILSLGPYIISCEWMLQSLFVLRASQQLQDTRMTLDRL